MNKTVKTVILAVGIVAVIAAAFFLYNDLAEKYAGDNLMVSETDTEQDASADGAESESAQEDYPSPDFTVRNEDWQKVRLSDYKGKPVVLNFWATWCYYCKVEMPDFNKAYEKYPNVQFMMVNVTDGMRETREKATKFVNDEGYGFDIFFDIDRSATSAYRVTSYPNTVFIDKDGNVDARVNGMLDLETLERGIALITDTSDESTTPTDPE